MRVVVWRGRMVVALVRMMVRKRDMMAVDECMGVEWKEENN